MLLLPSESRSTAEAELGVSADIQSYCGKCGTVWHVVVAMVGTQIAQVECKQCGRRHRVRGEEKVEAARPHRRTGAASTRAAKVVKPLVDADMTREPVNYSLDAHFDPGQRIEHATFGPGIVERILGPQKVQIYFASGSKVLAMGRRA
jgi:hypothetical protein